MGYNFTYAGGERIYMTCAAYGNNMYIGVDGTTTSTYVSTNGDYWTLGGYTSDVAQLNSDTIFWSDAFQFFVYINFDIPFLQTTTDGITWSDTYSVPTDNALGNLAWDGGDGFLYIIGKIEGVNMIFWTDDPTASAWNIVAALDPLVDWYGVAPGLGTTVLVSDGKIGYTTGSGPTIQVQMDASGYDDTNQYNCVSYGNNTFIAAGNGDTFNSSTDGITWTQQVAPNHPNFSSFGNQNFVFWENGSNSVSGPGSEIWTTDTTVSSLIICMFVGNPPGSHIAGCLSAPLYSDIIFHYYEIYNWDSFEGSDIAFAIPFRNLPTGQVKAVLAGLTTVNVIGHFEGNTFIFDIPPSVDLPEGCTNVYFEPISGVIVVDSVTPTTATFTWTSENATTPLRIEVTDGFLLSGLDPNGTDTLGGLTPGTIYTAYLYDDADILLYQVNFMTPTGISFGLTWFFAP
jgi:hypothetical protein